VNPEAIGAGDYFLAQESITRSVSISPTTWPRRCNKHLCTQRPVPRKTFFSGSYPLNRVMTNFVRQNIPTSPSRKTKRQEAIKTTFLATASPSRERGGNHSLWGIPCNKAQYGESDRSIQFVVGKRAPDANRQHSGSVESTLSSHRQLR
jgi:hypothetical protein